MARAHNVGSLLRIGICATSLFVGCAGITSATALNEQVLRVITEVDAGNFTAANALIDRELAVPRVTPAQREQLEFQRERMRRILIDFSLDEAQAQDRVRRQVPDLTAAEFARWEAAGLIENRVIDGRRLYFKRAPSNLFRLSSEARLRRKEQTPFNDGPFETAHPHHREIRDQSTAKNRAAVAPRRVQVSYSITVPPDAIPPGETLKAWLPFPRTLPGQQENVKLLSSSPSVHQLAPETALQRTVYMEQAARKGEPTVFAVRYELTTFAQFNALDPVRAQPAVITPELAQYVAQRPPHIVFTPAMRKFSAQVVGNEANPVRIAQKLFDAVDKIPWAGALEYSTLTNIGDYALHAGHADCGQQTLLLMTLLRLNGIPARWQSGWIFSDGEYNNMHDWGWLYLAPYGWVPMDVTFGKLSFGDPALDHFYFGGMDAYRIVFNDDFSQPFFPAKQHFRSETVDSQRGEVEWRGGNLYFDQWDYEFKAQVLPTS